MRNAKDELWGEGSGEYFGPKLFSQISEEMLFDHTIDSYKVRTLNLLSLCEELIQVVKDWDLGFVSITYVNPIREEILEQLDNEIFKNMLGHKFSYLKDTIKNWSKESKDKHSISHACGSILTEIENSFVFEVKENLKENVLSSGRQNKIEDLTGLFLSELIRLGYSKEYIYIKIKDHFFSEGGTPEERVEGFFEEWTNESKKYLVYFPCKSNHTARLLTQNSNKSFIRSEDGLPDCLYEESQQRGHSEFDVGKFLVFPKVHALDPYSARKGAEHNLEIATSLVGFWVHNLDTKGAKIALVVNELDSSDFNFVVSPKKPALKEPNKQENDIERHLRNVAGPFVNQEVDEETRERLLGSLRSHKAGVHAETYEDQFVNFWTSLETLTSKPGENNNFSVLSGRLVPILSKSYFLKLLSVFKRNMQNCKTRFFNELTREKLGDENQIELVLRFLCDSEFENARENFGRACSDSPLLFYRMDNLKDIFTSPNKAFKVLKKHEVRVGWHLCRMYRARNLLVHAGRKPNNIEFLIENLHSYVDFTFVKLLEKLRSDIRHYSSDKAFYDFKMEYESYKKSLADLPPSGENEIVSRAIVFG
jgi:hypothetical protein